MNATDKNALKLIAERYGWGSKGSGLAGSIAGDRMLEALLAASPSRDDIDRAASAFDARMNVDSRDPNRPPASVFLRIVESIAKITPTV